MMVTVRKYDWKGEFRYAWQGEIVRRETAEILIAAEWRGPGAPRVGRIVFAPGDRFLEYYYPGRAYAIWRVAGADDALKGWYCNIGTPLEERAGELCFNDLLLDLLVYPDGAYEVLDRDEFSRARQEGLSEQHAVLAEAALGDLLQLVHAGAKPFSFAAGCARLLEDG
jgi:predicted RNA-binding protein associated with RNAse of E/G family